MERLRILEDLASRIVRINLPHPVRVAIDGVDAAGKTTLARELTPLIQAHQRPVIRASIDGFHNPAHIRHGRGTTSPEGYYRDSFNYKALVEWLLMPLGPEGDLRYCSEVFDFKADSEIPVSSMTVEINAVLLFDGVFLLRRELKAHWDFTIFVEADFETTLERAIRRDCDLLGGVEETRKRYEQRYIPGQKLYFEECRPKQSAEVVLDNNNPSRLAIIS